MSERVIGVIGGSGIYDLDGLTEVHEQLIHTPFGPPSSPVITGRLGDTKMAFLARHDRGHRLLPHEINYRANIYAMKSVGAEWLLSLSAVGSMRESLAPGDMVIVDQFFDRTNGRASSFFGDGVAAHVGFGDPISPILSQALYEAAREVRAAEGAAGDFNVHKGGTYMVMNGPQFSTRAESNIYRQWGIDVIGMTNMPEAKLAREAEISFATLALVTDYDCWHESEADVSVEAVIAVVKKNAKRAREVVKAVVPKLPEIHNCIAANALANAIMTDPSQISEESRRRLGLFINKYLR